jgi:hypothetical protein
MQTSSPLAVQGTPHEQNLINNPEKLIDDRS